jgi:hypothetical protein
MGRVGSGRRSVAGIVAALAVLGTVTVVGVSASAKVPTTSLQKGAYVGSANLAGIASFDTETGTHSSVASDYLPADSGWSGLDGAHNSLKWLLSRGWTGSSYTLSLGVPMLLTDSSGKQVGSLAQGAAGAYNAYFTELAQNLVAGGEGNAYLRLGWEFDGNWFAWHATTPSQEVDFAAYFRQVVTVMRSVPGENFRFVWNPDAGAFTTAGYNVALAYPGNAYVDVIGLDAYDQSWVTPQNPVTAWDETTLPSINAARKFAAAQVKPLAFPEWGVAIRTDGHGLGDDPLFVDGMIAWMKSPTNHVAYESYFDASGRGTDSVITGGSFPSSLNAFSTAFGHPANKSSSSTPVGWLVAAVVALAILVGLWVKRSQRGRRKAPPNLTDQATGNALSGLTRTDALAAAGPPRRGS